MTDLSEQEIFDATVSREPVQDVPAEPQPETAPQPETKPDPSRDAHGRFASNPPPQEPAPQPAPEPEREPSIPPSRLREEAEARRQAEREAAELRGQLKAFMERQNPTPEPQKQPIDPISDPEGFYRDIGSQMEQMREQMRHEMRMDRMNGSFDRASREHGEKFKEALEAFGAVANPQRNGGDDRLRSEMLASYDPGKFVMDWHARNTLLSEIGTDPSAYQNRLIEAFLADPANHARLAEVLQPKQPAGNPPAQNTIKLPPSLNRTTSAAPNGPVGGTEPSDAELFVSTISRRR